MPRCMTSFALERWTPCAFVAITHNNDVEWSMSWTPMISYITLPIWVSIFSMKVDEFEGWLWSLFFHIGGGIIWCLKLAHINNPWLFRMIFIGLFIIRFIVINVQIGKVHKHGSKTSTIISILCPTILNDIFFSEIDIYKKNNNLMFTQVSTQCPFMCATIILLYLAKWDLVCHIWMLLALYHPCMANFV